MKRTTPTQFIYLRGIASIDAFIQELTTNKVAAAQVIFAFDSMPSQDIIDTFCIANDIIDVSSYTQQQLMYNLYPQDGAASQARQFLALLSKTYITCLNLH